MLPMLSRHLTKYVKAYPSDIVPFVVILVCETTRNVSQSMLTCPGVLSLCILWVVGDYSVEEVVDRSWRV